MQYPKLVESRTAANEVSYIEWNPGMDLLATVFSNGALTCSRLLSLQRVWYRQPNGKIVSIAWRPDGKVLAIGAYNEKTKENICTLHDVENGKEVYFIKKDRPITCVAWFQHSLTKNDKNFKDPFKPKKSNPIVFPSIKSFSHQLAHQQDSLNILIISTDDSHVSLYSLGLFYLGDVILQNNLSPVVESKILKIHMSCCMKFMTCMHSNSQGVNTMSSLRVLKLDTFQARSNEVLKVSKIYAKITDELGYLDDTMNAISTSWTDVLAGLDNKLSSYSSRKTKSPDDSDNGYTFLSADELLQLLVLGFPSDNLEKFLTDMSDKGLKKLNTSIEETCQRVQNLIVKNAQKCCYHLHNDLNMLRGMSLWHEKFSDVGLDDKTILEAMRGVGALMLKLTEVQQVIDHSLRSTNCFFRWLISITTRMISTEYSNSVIANDINKTTQQDIQLITDFILENFDYNYVKDDLNDISSSVSWPNRPTCSNFTLEQVGQYFKNEPLSRLKPSFTKADSNFWIEFFKKRPETTEPKYLEEDGFSVLLFYPHNAETSLVQEHKNACKAIGSAFENVANNIKLVSGGEGNFTNLRDFLKNAPANRIRIETDMKLRDHYTLFQTKQGLVTKQYLISQSLDDKSFKLTSISFQQINRKDTTSGSRGTHSSDNNILISDSCFYENKDLKRMLVSFLLVDNRDTLIAQIDLQKILELGHEERILKDAAKVFRSHDSIDKFSSHVVLKLDTRTEPPSMRKHQPEMMVKKIKGTTGKDMFASSGRGVIAFTSNSNKRLHLYELESSEDSTEFMDDEVGSDEKIDESFIDTDLI